MKITRRDLRSMGACLSGRVNFHHFFKNGAELTYENAVQALRHVPTGYIHWFLNTYVGPGTGSRFQNMYFRSQNRAVRHDTWDKEERYMAMWLLRVVKKALEGGDAKPE